MSAQTAAVIKRIVRELPDLDRTIIRAERSWKQAPTAVDIDVYVDSAGLHLQSFYTGLERIFEQTARQIDEKVPTGDSWHYDLLLQMGRELAGIRPALLSSASVKGLDEFRRFRHVVRNVYATNLDPEKMENLFTLLPDLWPQVRSELLAFADFLRLMEDETDAGE